ncbi:MAG: ACT domain-containing protein [Spirochaetes bacterium]|nr:MAG: ACT domain-containing protein [Spirochaetota bacterium]
MKSFLVFSSMGPDRPGLVSEISEYFTARGINIERSRMSTMGNEFGGIILTSGRTEDIKSLIDDLDSLRAKTGLDIHVRQTKAPGHREVKPSIPYRMIATSMDHPGIVHKVCKVLKEKDINVEEFETQVDYNAFTGANVFHMTCYFTIPANVRIADVRKDVARVGDELNIDIRIEAVINR